MVLAANAYQVLSMFQGGEGAMETWDMARGGIWPQVSANGSGRHVRVRDLRVPQAASFLFWLGPFAHSPCRARSLYFSEHFVRTDGTVALEGVAELPLFDHSSRGNSPPRISRHLHVSPYILSFAPFCRMCFPSWPLLNTFDHTFT